MVSRISAHLDGTVSVFAIVHVPSQHIYPVGAFFTDVVVAVSIGVEVLGHLTNENAVWMSAGRPHAHVGLTTLVGQQEKVILKTVVLFHWLERKGKRRW